jgi:hypothetical protein
MLGKPTAGTLLAGVPLCLRPEELCMLLSDDVSSLDVVEKHSQLSFMYLDVELLNVETLAHR